MTYLIFLYFLRMSNTIENDISPVSHFKEYYVYFKLAHDSSATFFFSLPPTHYCVHILVLFWTHFSDSYFICEISISITYKMNIYSNHSNAKFR